MQNIDTFDFKEKKVLIRVDFNIPMSDKLEIVDDIRIRATLPTINKVLSSGGSVILISHLGRPKGGYDQKYSLKHLVSHLEKVLDRRVQFSSQCIGDEAKHKCRNIEPGEIILLENVRFYKEEQYAEDDFAQELARLGDVYINDAFGTSHRDHASVTTVARYFEHKMMGYVMRKEVESADKVIKNPDHPFTTILGGAKVSDKIDLIEGLTEKADNILIGGGMAFTFIKAFKGNIGNSKIEPHKIETARNLYLNAKKNNVNFVLPVDAVISQNFDNQSYVSVSDIDKIPEGWYGLDIGPKTIKIFSKIIQNSLTILWNGPLGVYEMSKFRKGTKSVAEEIVKASKRGSFSLVGGGDSASAVHVLGYQNDVSYISTGGGALLSYIVDGTLPGINALELE